MRFEISLIQPLSKARLTRWLRKILIAKKPYCEELLQIQRTMTDEGVAFRVIVDSAGVRDAETLKDILHARLLEHLNPESDGEVDVTLL